MRGVLLNITMVLRTHATSLEFEAFVVVVVRFSGRFLEDLRRRELSARELRLLPATGSWTHFSLPCVESLDAQRLSSKTQMIQITSDDREKDDEICSASAFSVF